MILLHSRFALFKQALAFGAIRIIHVPELKKKYSFKKYQCFRRYFKWYGWVLQRKPYAWKTIAITNRFSILMRCLAAQIRASVIKKKILDKQTLTHARIEIPVLVFFSSIYNKTNGFFTPFKIYSNTMPTKCFTIHFKLTLVKLISVSSRRSFFFRKISNCTSRYACIKLVRASRTHKGDYSLGV